MMNTGRAFLAFSITIFVLSAASLFSAASDGATETYEPSAQTPHESVPLDCERYIIRTSDGRVMLYDSSGSEPIRELDISYNDLPPEDRALLDSGLLVEDRERLLALIEDYTG